MPNEKGEVAIFDNDLKCRTIKKYEVSDSGDQIRINPKGGEGFWMPSYGTDSFIELPKRKRYFFFGDIIWRRLYFVKKRGDECVNFQTGKAFGPNPEETKKALGSTMLGQIGKVKAELSWIDYVTLAIVGILLLVELGVFR